MRLEIPYGTTSTAIANPQVVEVVTWFEDTGDIIISEPLQDDYDSTSTSKLTFPEDPQQRSGNYKLRFGRERVMLDEYTQQLAVRKVVYQEDTSTSIPDDTYYTGLQGRETAFSSVKDASQGLITGTAYDNLT